MGGRPRRRKELIVQELRDEVLVYDLETHRASCLNRVAGAALRACDGRRGHAAIASEMARRLGAPVDLPYARLALDRLRKAGLLEAPPQPLPPGRRDALKRLAAAAAIGLPAVTTVLAPEPAAAQTCLPNGKPCLTSSQCCSGCCNSMSGRCGGGKMCV